MLGRNAVVLPLGMLMQEVDASPFIGLLLGKAAQANANFKFTDEIKKFVFGLAQQYNVDKTITFSRFRTELLLALGIDQNAMDEATFKTEWNKMVKVGNVAEKVRDLQKLADDYRITFYISSDTNRTHLAKISEECALLKLDETKTVQQLGEFPLYASCFVGKNRFELTQDIVKAIKEQSIQAAGIRLMLGDPKNNTNETLRQRAQGECEKIQMWAAENNVVVDLYNNQVGLVDALKGIFEPANVATNERRVVMG